MSSSGVAAGGPPTGAAGGDIAGTGTSTYPNPTLTAIGSVAGPIGSSTVTPVVTIDTKGRVTALTSAASGGAGLTVATVQLNAAAIAAMFSAPVTLVAAPGANRVLDVQGVAYETVAGVTGYDAGGAGIYYAGHVVSSEGLDVQANVLTMLGSGAPISEVLSGIGTDENPFPIATAANKGLVVAMPTANPTRFGAIVTSTLAGGGLGYAVGDTGTIDNPRYGAAAAYVVDTVTSVTGIVLTYHLTNAGTGYSTAVNPIATTAAGAQPGVGTGLTLNVTAIPAADGIFYVTVYYTVLTTH